MAELDNATKTAIRSHYVAAGFPQSQVDNLIGQMKFHNHADFSDFINLTGPAVTTFNNATNMVAQRNNKILDVIKNTDVVEQFREAIVEVIKEKLVPHIRNFAEASSEPSRYSDQALPCALKAFTIEYATKAIHALSSTTGTSDLTINNNRFQTNNYLATCLCNALRGDFSNFAAKTDAEVVDLILGTNLPPKERIEHLWSILNNHVIYNIKSLQEVLNVTHQPKILGHEIDNMVNGLPQNISALIKYKGMTYLANDKISAVGQVPNEDDFIDGVDLILMDKAFLTATEFEQQQRKLSENTNAFVELRYIERLVKEGDYQSLSALSAATQTILDFVLKHKELAIKNVNANSSVWSTIFTSEEMTKLSELETNNPTFNKDNLYFYYAFLKTYIDTRKIDFNDNKYKNINKLFEIIKSTGNITAINNEFLRWYSTIDPYSLSREELRELEGVFPKYFFQSLSYEDKHMYQLCKQHNIPFEYHYKINPKSFEKILELCGNESFQTKAIPVELLKKAPSEITELHQYLITQGLNLSSVPSYLFKHSVTTLVKHNEFFQNYGIGLMRIPAYYFDYSIEELQKAINKADGITGIYASEEFLASVRREEKVSKNLQQINFFENMYNQQMNQILIEGALEMQKQIDLEEQAKAQLKQQHIMEIYQRIPNALRRRKSLTAQLIQEGYTNEEIGYAFIIKDVESKCKIPASVLATYSFEELKRMNLSSKKFPQNIHGVPIIQSGPQPLINNKLAQTRRKNTAKDIQRIMNSISEIMPGMKSINESEVMANYVQCRTFLPNVEPGEYLLYKTPIEVNGIASKFEESLMPEMLYLDMDILLELEQEIIIGQIYRVRQLRHVNNSKIPVDEILDYQNACFVNELLRQKLEDKKATARKAHQEELEKEALRAQIAQLEAQLVLAEQNSKSKEQVSALENEPELDKGPAPAPLPTPQITTDSSSPIVIHSTLPPIHPIQIDPNYQITAINPALSYYFEELYRKKEDWGSVSEEDRGTAIESMFLQPNTKPSVLIEHKGRKL